MAEITAFDEHARRAARTYGSAADHFDRPALGFWDRFGAETVKRLQLAPGQAVLDLCCGAGLRRSRRRRLWVRVVESSAWT